LQKEIQRPGGKREEKGTECAVDQKKGKVVCLAHGERGHLHKILKKKGVQP